MISLSQLQAIFGTHITEELHDALVHTMMEYEIGETKEVAAFLAQVGHESNGFRARKENLNYSAQGLVKVFPKYFNATTAQAYARQPQKIANRVYANRMGNGDESSGDGYKFCGKGFIQITGKNNTSAYAKYKGMGINEALAYLETLEGACDSAGWYWNTNKLGQYVDDFTKLTKKINGGTIGLQDREHHFSMISDIMNQSA